MLSNNGDVNLWCWSGVVGGIQCTVHCTVRFSRGGLTWWCCQVYYDEEAGEEGGREERLGRVGGRHAFHEVRDVHVGNWTEVNLPTRLRTVVGMLQPASVGHEVSVSQLTLPLPLPGHQAAVEPVHGVRGDGLGVVVAGEIVVQRPDWPGLQLGLGQREGELTVVQHLEIQAEWPDWGPRLGVFAYLAIIDAIFVQSNGRAWEDWLTDSIQSADGRDARWHESPWNWLSYNVNMVRYYGNMRSLNTKLERVFKISSGYLICGGGREGKSC